MVFAQLTYRESLRSIEASLLGHRAAAYRMGIRGRVTRTNHAYANTMPTLAATWTSGNCIACNASPRFAHRPRCDDVKADAGFKSGDEEVLCQVSECGGGSV
jgi:hypothetical protein